MTTELNPSNFDGGSRHETTRRQYVGSILNTLTTTVTLAGIIAFGVTTWTSHIQTRSGADEPPPPSAPISLEGATLRGNRASRVALIEYTDFECPFCARFATTVLPDLMRRYVDTGRVLYGLRHRPLQMHRYAQKAAEAAVCAERQGRFWEMHDLLFGRTSTLNDAVISRMASGLRMDQPAFDACLRSDAIDRVSADIRQAEALSMRSTPAFFVGSVESDGRVRVRRRVLGTGTVQSFSALLDDALR